MGGPWEDYQTASQPPPWRDYAPAPKPKPKPGDDTRDAILSFGSGAVQGALGLANMLNGRDAMNMGAHAATSIANHLMHASPERAAAMQSIVDNTLPGTGAMMRASHLDHQSTTTAGRYANSIGQMVPNAALGPEGVLPRLAAVVIPGVTSQGSEDVARAAGAGPKGQAAARFAGAVAGGLASGVRPNFNSAAPSAARAARSANAAAFEQAGVRPTLAAVRGGESAPVTKAIAENPIAGIRARGHIQASLDDTAAAAGKLAGEYGVPRTRQAAGDIAKAGVERFVKDPNAPNSFKARSGQLYDAAWAKIPDGPVQATATSQALGSILGRVQTPELAAKLNSPEMKAYSDILAKNGGQLPFGDLRAFRTAIREAQKNPELRQGMSEADLQRLEGALTTDIRTGANTLGGPAAGKALRQADTYYRVGSDRIKRSLNSVFKAGSEENAYDLILRAAKDQGGGDAVRLTALKRSLAPHEWGDIAATTISRMGKVNPGAPNAMEEGAFSVNNFVKNYAAMSDVGRETMFGARAGGGARAGDLKAALDNLVKVAGLQKGVEAAANHSKSGVAVQTVGTIAGLANPATAIPVAKGIAGLAITGEALTNPAFVRWLTRAPKQSQAANVQQLKILARKDPSLQQIVQQIAGPAVVSAASASSEPR